MPVENNKVIDAISINPQGLVVLTISDHFEWDSNNEHLIILQEKINAYLEAIESGQIYESYPDAKNRRFQIGIAFKYPPNKDAMNFLEKVNEILLQSGYELKYYVLDDGLS